MARSRDFARDRYAEATETLRALLRTPFRVARRSSNHAHELSVAATNLARIRHQLHLSATWIDADHPRLGAAFRATMDRVEGEVRPRIQTAWSSPDDAQGGWTEPPPEMWAIVKSWQACARLRFMPGRMLLPLALSRHDRLLETGSG